MKEWKFFPDQASTMAVEVDQLYWFFIVVCGLAGVVTFLVAIVLAIRYRAEAKRHEPSEGHSTLLEIGWTIPVAAVCFILFLWGAKIFVSAYTMPDEAMEIYVTGKQWMWKVQHPNGKREINEIHIPLGQKVKLMLTSEDVIHSFYIPAFRTKRDVVPGRYNQMWFEATMEGEFHLFCAEYCGAEHSLMIGKAIVMKPDAYEAWLSGSGGPMVSMVDKGKQLFTQHACQTCHAAGPGQLGPKLDGIFETEIPLMGGGTVVADASYLRESILKPAAKIHAGFAPVMPMFQGVINEEGVAALVAYIKSLDGAGATASVGGAQ